MQWGDPNLRHLLWLLIPAALLLHLAVKHRRRRLGQLADAPVLDILVPGYNPRQARLKHLLWLAAMAGALLSLARPQWGFTWEEVQRRGLDIMVVLDTSKSMLATDIKPNRLQRAKWGVADLIKKLEGDRIGLVAFSGSSFLQCPLTIDYAAFMLTLDDIYAGIIPRGGTEIAQALESAVQSFEKDTKSDKVIVLITDGESHKDAGKAILEKLKKEKIRVYSVGVGTLDGELIPVPDDEGALQFLKNKQGNVVKTALNESFLEDLAVHTGGTYVRSLPGDFGLERIYDQGISRLKRAELDSRMAKRHEDRFVWFLAFAFALFVLEAAITSQQKKGKMRHA